jgi:hypothetical protein
MRPAFKYLAYLIPVLVLVQAAAIAWAVFGLGHWIDGGGTLDKAAMESNTFHFGEERGFMIHGINGQMVIPLISIVVLVLSFLAKVPGGTKWAAILLVDVIVQVVLGMTAHSAPVLGMLHGINAFAVAAIGWYVGRLASEPVPVTA